MYLHPFLLRITQIAVTKSKKHTNHVHRRQKRISHREFFYRRPVSVVCGRNWSTVLAHQ